MLNPLISPSPHPLLPLLPNLHRTPIPLPLLRSPPGRAPEPPPDPAPPFDPPDARWDITSKHTFTSQTPWELLRPYIVWYTWVERCEELAQSLDSYNSIRLWSFTEDSSCTSELLPNKPRSPNSWQRGQLATSANRKAPPSDGNSPLPLSSSPAPRSPRPLICSIRFDLSSGTLPAEAIVSFAYARSLGLCVCNVFSVIRSFFLSRFSSLGFRSPQVPSLDTHCIGSIAT